MFLLSIFFYLSSCTCAQEARARLVLNDEWIFSTLKALNPLYFHFQFLPLRTTHRSTLSPRHTTIANYLSPASVDDVRQSIAAVGQPLASNTGESRLDSPLSSGVTYVNPTVYHNSPLLLQQQQQQPKVLYNNNNNNDEDDNESDSPQGYADPEDEEEDRVYQEMGNSIDDYLLYDDEREV